MPNAADGRRSGFRHRRTLVVAALLAALAGIASLGVDDPAYAGRPEAVTLDEKVELGRRLFFDPAVSRSGHVSCASCHDPDHGFSDPRTLSKDDDFKDTRRHSMTLVDCAPSPAVHWDGEFATVASLVFARIGSRQEFEREIRKPREDLPKKRIDRRLRSRYAQKNRGSALSDVPVADVVARSGRYASSAKAAFGTRELKTKHIAEAIQAYVATIRSTPGPFDRYRDGDVNALSDSAVRGLQLFKGRAGCAQCHAIEGKHPTFTDYKFHDTGVSFRAAKDKLTGSRGRLLAAGRDKLAKVVMGGRVPQIDGGRVEITGDGEDFARFKTPSLRDVAVRPPYMHDGSFKTLEDVVRYYAQGGTREDKNLDKLIHPFEASDRDVADLVAFLECLTGDVRPGRAPAAWKLRPSTMRIGLVDRNGRALVGIPVTIRTAGDELPGMDKEPTKPLVTDAHGRIAFSPPASTHVRVVLPGDLRVAGGNLVPDTVRDVRLAVPVEGRARITVRTPAGRGAPAELVLQGAERSLVATLEKTDEGVATYGVWLQDRSDFGTWELDGETELGRTGTVPVKLAAGRTTHVELD